MPFDADQVQEVYDILSTMIDDHQLLFGRISEPDEPPVRLQTLIRETDKFSVLLITLNTESKFYHEHEAPPGAVH